MSIPGDYPKPVMVNGYLCNNCTDVANAKKIVDPAHPDEATQPKNDVMRPAAVFYGGLLAGRFRSSQATAEAVAGSLSGETLSSSSVHSLNRLA